MVVDIYWDAKCRGLYPLLFTDPEGDSCFSIYQIRWIKKCRFINGHNLFFWNFRETTRHFSFHSHNSEYPRIFQVMGAIQDRWKSLSTDLINTKERDLKIVNSILPLEETTFLCFKMAQWLFSEDSLWSCSIELLWCWVKILHHCS